MKSAGKARNNGLYRHIRTSKEIIRNLLNDLSNIKLYKPKLQRRTGKKRRFCGLSCNLLIFYYINISPSIKHGAKYVRNTCLHLKKF